MSKPKSSTKPFFHKLIPNFLSDKQFKKLTEIYAKLQFKEKTSDLFHFFQTNQLAAEKKLQFFRESLSKQFKTLCTAEEFKNSSYSIFASYYFQGDYLLCHDDIVEDRKYAFSYYLEDFKDGGELVLFNDRADQIEKKISVKKNTIAIFQVCDESYHEVAYCYGTGRKAVTGWFNVKGQGASRIPKVIPPFCPHQIEEPLLYPLDEAHIEEEYFQMMDIQYQFNIKKETIEGPFYSRRVHRLQIDPAVVFQVPGYKIFSVDYYRIKEGDYILLNDPVNTLGEDLIDIFVTNLPEGFETDEQNMLIKIVEEDGSLSGIPEVDDSLFVVRRQKKQYYIERNKKEFVIAHFIYRKQEEQKKTTKNKNTKAKAKKVIAKVLKKESKAQDKNKKLPKTKKKAPTIKSTPKNKKTVNVASKPLPKAKNSRKIAKTVKKVAKK